MTTSALPTAPVPRRRARMAAYALWQSRDFVMNTAIISVILFGLIGAMMIMNIHSQEEMMAMRHLPPPADAAKVNGFREIYGMFAMVAPLIVLSGFISQDRSSGFTRFLFAKPVAPRTFYLQSFLVRLAGFLVLGQVLVLAYAAFEPPAYTPRFIVDMCLSFIAVGGIVVLLSALSKYDGLIAIVFLLVASIFWEKWEHAAGWKHVLPYAFPPIGRIGELHSWVIGTNEMGSIVAVAFPTKWALWLAGYGLACGALGLYLLRRIPLTKA